MNVLDFLKKLLGCQEEKYRKLVGKLNIEIGKLEDDIEELLDELNEVKMSADVIIPEDIKKKALELKNEYPEANIIYKGYVINLKTGDFKPSVKVQDFIQVLHSHRKWIEERNLTLKKYLEKYPSLSFGEVVNKLMFDIYKAYAPIKSYMYDKDLYGLAEQWAPTIDTWYLKKMDCENSTIELMALFEASGLVGELKNFYWNVCGMCQLGGHSTLYCWDFKNNCWRHFETTVRKVTASDFYSLPTNKDKNDKLNITNVWFSFNSDVARHKFKTDVDKESFKKKDRFKDIVIK